MYVRRRKDEAREFLVRGKPVSLLTGDGFTLLFDKHLWVLQNKTGPTPTFRSLAPWNEEPSARKNDQNRASTTGTHASDAKQPKMGEHSSSAIIRHPLESESELTRPEKVPSIVQPMELTEQQKKEQEDTDLQFALNLQEQEQREAREEEEKRKQARSKTPGTLSISDVDSVDLFEFDQQSTDVHENRNRRLDNLSYTRSTEVYLPTKAPTTAQPLQRTHVSSINTTMPLPATSPHRYANPPTYGDRPNKPTPAPTVSGPKLGTSNSISRPGSEFQHKSKLSQPLALPVVKAAREPHSTNPSSTSSSRPLPESVKHTKASASTKSAQQSVSAPKVLTISDDEISSDPFRDNFDEEHEIELSIEPENVLSSVDSSPKKRHWTQR
jgi:hypothetical protein